MNVEEIKLLFIILSPRISISLNVDLFEFLLEYSGWYPQLDNKKLVLKISFALSDYNIN